MNFARVKAATAAVMLTVSMAMPNMTVFAADVTKAGTDIITKTVQADNGVSFTDQTFKYTFEQEKEKDDSNVKANLVKADIDDVTITMSGTSDKSKDFAQETKSYTQTAGQTAKDGATAIDLSNIEKAGVYTYIVSESEGGTTADKTTWKNDTAKYRMRVYATNKYDEAKKEYTVDRSITLIKLDENGNETGNKLDTADFTNKIAKTSTFAIGKYVDGGTSYIPDGTTYNYEVTFAFDDLNKEALGVTDTTEFDYIITDGTSTIKSGKIASGGKIEGLPANAYIQISGLPVGTTVVTNEVDNPANVASTKYDAYVGKVQTKTGAEGATTDAVLVDEDGSSVYFTNTWKDVTVTGVVTNNAPYIAMVVLAGAAVAGYIVLKRKIAR